MTDPNEVSDPNDVWTDPNHSDPNHWTDPNHGKNRSEMNCFSQDHTYFSFSWKTSRATRRI